MYTLVTVIVLTIISSSTEPFLSTWAYGVGILFNAVRDSAMVKNVGSSIRLF